MLACGDTIDLRVRDTGVGIDRSFLPRVFQLYQSAHLPRGNGIGLTVARHIVELHDGSIEVTSGGVNQGAEVRISLPIDRVQVPETV
jgi:signal transduction histidine kinase